MEEYNHPDTYNTGDRFNPVIPYEEYINNKEDNDADHQLTDNSERG